ncbi:unnamed protein product, partial [Laminaria digitata]
MNPRILYPVAAAVIAALMTLTGCGSQNSAPGDGDNIYTGAGESETAEGPHGGRLLEEGDFALEMTIFESGVPPEYRIYPFLAGEPVDPSRVALTVRLDRLGDEEDIFEFSPVQDYLKGDGVVTEPHSFEVFVDAQHQGTSYSWSYESFEGRTTIADDTAVSMGVETEIAGAAVIRDIIPLSGVTTLSPSATAEVRARYPGPVQSVSVGVNDMVRKGQTLARVESSSSLQSYSVTAPVSGTILERNTNAGDVAGDQS